MIEFEIDGKKISVPEGTTIIEAADEAGVYIPRFCYHKKLSIAANCRMCLVEVEKSRKPLPACATPITPDMKVSTKSSLALHAQRDVMEFLLINHPLDCPICDQGGVCELQDLSLGFGRSYSEYDQTKRAVYSQDIGPLIETEMTRCIQCTRCVRFGEEVAGLRELGVVNRGEKEEIGTYVKHLVRSEVSGNVIDLCPVGALTNKPARYALRGWEAIEHPTISSQDCVGTNMYLHTRGREYTSERQVFQSVPRENETINETWMSDRDRFSVSAFHHEDRVFQPMMKKHGKWQKVEWSYALDAIAHLVNHIKETEGADQLAGIANSGATVEENYLLQKLIRSLGSANIDHRVRESDFSDQQILPTYPSLGMSIADIETRDTILLLGSNIRKEQPILSTRLFKATQDGLKVMSINPVDEPFVFEQVEKLITADFVEALAEVTVALSQIKQRKIDSLGSIVPSEAAIRMAEKLHAAEKPALLLGAYALNHPYAATIRRLADLIAQLSGATVGSLTQGPNAAGAWIAGCVPHRGVGGALVDAVGKSAKELLVDEPVSGYFLLNVEPEFDTTYPKEALAALKKAKLVVCLSTFATDAMYEYADFILPVAPMSETAGTYVNVEGQWQSFTAASVPHGQSKPAWKILRVIANFLDLPGFAYQSTLAVIESVKHQMDQCEPQKNTEGDNAALTIPEVHEEALRCVFNWHIYRDNPLVRRSTSLQKLIRPEETMLQLNKKTAQKYQLSSGEKIAVDEEDASHLLEVHINDLVSDDLAIFPAGFSHTAGLGAHLSSLVLMGGAK